MRHNQSSQMRKAIGKLITRDIFTVRGVPLIAKGTLLTKQHIKMMEGHGIMLCKDDLEETGVYETSASAKHEAIVDGAVDVVQDLFEQIRITKRVPIAELRSDIIPLMYELTASRSMFDLFASLQAKDDYTFRHNIAVGVIAGWISSWLGMNQHEQLQVTTAGLLHDVGKMIIPKEILNKPGKLSEDEFKLMKKHTVFGYEILKNTVGVSYRQALVALQHHERMDGSGYPLGLVSEQIDVFSRIVAVADVFHAMTSTRVYRNRSPFYEVLSQMDKDAFGVLDPLITKRFIEKMMNQLIGRPVMMTNGMEGVIVWIHPHEPTRPLVQTEDGFIDLVSETDIHIEQIL